MQTDRVHWRRGRMYRERERERESHTFTHKQGRVGSAIEMQTWTSLGRMRSYHGCGCDDVWWVTGVRNQSNRISMSARHGTCARNALCFVFSMIYWWTNDGYRPIPHAVHVAISHKCIRLGYISYIVINAPEILLNIKINRLENYDPCQYRIAYIIIIVRLLLNTEFEKKIMHFCISTNWQLVIILYCIFFHISPFLYFSFVVD